MSFSKYRHLYSRKSKYNGFTFDNDILEVIQWYVRVKPALVDTCFLFSDCEEYFKLRNDALFSPLFEELYGEG